MAPRDFSTRLTRRAARSGLFLTDELVERLQAFYELLSRWNAKINLTSLKDPDEAIDRLFLEPILAARFVPAGADSLIDIGSGGGSPAVPMKVMLPRLRLVMVEAKARKSAFLREATRHLELDNTTVETARVEELLPKVELHERFHVVSLRAVRVEARLMNTAQAFLAPGGHVFLFRGPTGPVEPSMIVPPLEYRETVPLVEALQSRLTVLAKRAERSTWNKPAPGPAVV